MNSLRIDCRMFAWQCALGLKRILMLAVLLSGTANAAPAEHPIHLTWPVGWTSGIQKYPWGIVETGIHVKSGSEVTLACDPRQGKSPTDAREVLRHYFSGFGSNWDGRITRAAWGGMDGFTAYTEGAIVVDVLSPAHQFRVRMYTAISRRCLATATYYLNKGSPLQLEKEVDLLLTRVRFD